MHFSQFLFYRGQILPGSIFMAIIHLLLQGYGKYKVYLKMLHCCVLTHVLLLYAQHDQLIEKFAFIKTKKYKLGLRLR